MTIDEFIKMVEQSHINAVDVKKVEEMYSVSLNEFLSRIISADKESIFIEDGVRKLSFYEILNSDDEYGTEFVAMHIIPLFDFEDNDFLGFDYLDNTWKMYNIVDKCIFDSKENLMDFFKK